MGRVRHFFSIFANRRLAITLIMGFFSGLPLALTASTFQAWMVTENINLTTIGIFGLVGLPYSMKFLWSPLMDRYAPPFLGRRRGWILLAQLGLAVTIGCLALLHPSNAPVLVAILATLLAFLSASQDIVIDAYRIELLRPEEFGMGAGLVTMGYRIAMLTSGALALILSDHMPWRSVYLIMAGIMLLGTVVTIFAPEVESKILPPRNLSDAVVLPFVEFFKRKGAFEMLAFMILYKLDATMTMTLSPSFMIRGLGFSKTDIGAVNNLFGMVATICGTLLGGTLMVRLKLLRSLWIFGIFQMVSTLSYSMLAYAGKNYSAMVTAIALENFCSGLANAAFAAFIMSLSNKRFTATQYALLTSFMALARYMASAPSGFLAQSLGWQQYFLLCMVCGIPGLLLLFRFPKWTMPTPENGSAHL